MATQENETIERAAARAGQYRWVVVGLLFAATVINYIDRQMIGVLKPVLSADLGWSETDFANVIFWFQAAYAIGYLGFGRIVDVIGARAWFLAGVCAGYSDWAYMREALSLARRVGYRVPTREHWLVKAVGALAPRAAVLGREAFIRTVKPGLRRGFPSVRDEVLPPAFGGPEH